MAEQSSTAPSASPTLVEAILAPHDVLAERLAQARVEGTAPGDPRSHAGPCDVFLAMSSEHLAAAEEVLYPAARRRLTDGRDQVSAQMHLSRQLERVLRDIEGSLYGDVFVADAARAGLWDEAARLLAQHAEGERKLVARLTETLDHDEQRKLGESFAAAVERAPTRPHPYSPHSAVLGRVSNRLWSLADRAMDTMDNRSVPHKPAPPHAPADSRWGQYVLGQPAFDEEPPPEQ
jgi:hypothetical protein